ncbi:MAG: tape measure protein, partial [bacterium]|nr:tape measure protein [bacterium]
MSEDIQEFGIEFEVGHRSYKNVTKFEKRLMRMQKKIASASNVTLGIQEKVIRGSGGGGSGGKRQHIQGPSLPKGGKSAWEVAERQREKFNENLRKDAKAQVELERKQNRERLKSSVEGLTSPSGSGKASQTAFADILRKEEKERKKALQKEEAQRKRVNSVLKKDMFYHASISDEMRKMYRTQLQSAKSEDHFLQISRKIRKSVRDTNRDYDQRIKKQRQSFFLQQRMVSSSKQLAGNMVSAFAVVGSGTFITQTGQNFESVRNTMLAVSKDTEEAGMQMKFVRDESYRLGLGLKESAKQFAKMISARGTMSLEQTKEAFLGISEMSTLLGLSADESGRAMTALTQMMSKGQVMAEELKGQLGEVMPNGLKIMGLAAKDAGLSVNGTVGELMKLMEQGRVATQTVLPFFAKRMREAAQANGALEKALDSNRVAMNRFLFATTEAADIIFKTGFGEGLTDFFNTSGDSLRKLEPLWKALGRIIGSVFKVVSRGIDLITPPLRLLGMILDSITERFGDMSFVITTLFGAG